MTPIGTLMESAVRFSGQATSISASLYVATATGAYTLSGTSVTLGTAVDQGSSPAQTLQPFSVPTTGRSHGDRLEVRVTGTVGGASETHSVFETVTAASSTFATGGDVNVASIGANVITDGAIADGAITAAKVAQGVLDKVWSTTTAALDALAATAVGKWFRTMLDVAIGTRSDGSDTAGTTTLLARLTAARAGYLDNLNTAGVVASQTDVLAINQSASRRIILATVGQYERPETGSTTYTIEARTYDADGTATNATTTPTLTATGIVSGALSANLSAGSSSETGVYRWTYTVANSATLEQVRFDVSAAMTDGTFTLSAYTQVADFVAATFTTADRTLLQSAKDNTDTLTTRIPGTVQPQTGDAFARLGAPAGASIAADVAAVKSDTGNLISRVTSTLFSGITALADWLRLGSRKDTGFAGRATAITEMNAGTSAGVFDNTTDSNEAIRDRGDAAWVTGSGGGGGGGTAQLDMTQATPAGSTVGAQLDKAGSVCVVPLQSRVALDLYKTGGVEALPLSMAQKERRTFAITFTATDENGAETEIDLTGKSLRFLVRDRNMNGLFEIENGPNLTIASLGKVSITVSESQSNQTGLYEWECWNVTDHRRLGRGPMLFDPALKDVP